MVPSFVAGTSMRFGSIIVEGDLLGGGGGPQAGRASMSAFWVNGYYLGTAVTEAPSNTTGIVSVDLAVGFLP